MAEHGCRFEFHGWPANAQWQLLASPAKILRHSSSQADPWERGIIVYLRFLLPFYINNTGESRAVNELFSTGTSYLSPLPIFEIPGNTTQRDMNIIRTHRPKSYYPIQTFSWITWRRSLKLYRPWMEQLMTRFQAGGKERAERKRKIYCVQLFNLFLRDKTPPPPSPIERPPTKRKIQFTPWNNRIISTSFHRGGRKKSNSNHHHHHRNPGGREGRGGGEGRGWPKRPSGSAILRLGYRPRNAPLPFILSFIRWIGGGPARPRRRRRRRRRPSRR